MKVIILQKGVFGSLPQIMALATIIKELGHEVIVLTSSSRQQTKTYFFEKGIEIVDLCSECDTASSSMIRRFHNWKVFSKKAWPHINESGKDTLLWISSADTALALGKRLLQRCYILHIRELYDQIIFYHYRVALAKYAQHARCVVVPEISRACIFRYWYHLKETPIVLPNKPTEHPRKTHLEVEDARARNILQHVSQNDKILLYQGGISSDRDLRSIAQAVQQMGNEWRFIVMGNGDNNYIEALKRYSSKVIHIPNVPAPEHLQVTSHAYIGVVAYSLSSLNNIFCAPNKTWEYAGFGLPMLCNNLPTLQASVQTHGAGLCVDTENSDQVMSALTTIDENYQVFRNNAQQYYDSIDIRSIVQSIMDQSHSSKRFCESILRSRSPIHDYSSDC